MNIDELKTLAQNAPSDAPLAENETLKKFHETLDELRRDGVNKIADLKQEIAIAKKNKMISADEREKLISDYNAQIEKAKIVAANNKDADAELSKIGVQYANAAAEKYIAKVDAEQDKIIAETKSNLEKEIAKIKADGVARIASAQTDVDKETAKYELKSALFDAKNRAQTTIDRCKDAKKQAFTDHTDGGGAYRG